MKHYFVDTNVVIDMLANRERFADVASELFDSAGRGEIRISICALSYSTIFYILKKYSGRRNTKDFSLSKLPVLLPGEYLA